ncbi:hypothetical protein TNIN_198741 [Trichonephila inaurata madagascariensis]|uniref:Uncharacterized protein n=1 Tax=Trichonephila inaurata madagascariensis TaxID=2747483 RepID=A0A8X7CTJ5_9ARAC|nr:hypothetical protein TNIN_198741 [Trichonephila inaurata madagascariensis]
MNSYQHPRAHLMLLILLNNGVNISLFPNFSGVLTVKNGSNLVENYNHSHSISCKLLPSTSFDVQDYPSQVTYTGFTRNDRNESKDESSLAHSSESLAFGYSLRGRNHWDADVAVVFGAPPPVTKDDRGRVALTQGAASPGGAQA